MYTNNLPQRRALRLKPLAACLLPMLALAEPALASSVTSCADDGGFDTLRHAVLVADPGGTIDLSSLSCSKITLQAGAGPIAVGLDDLTIKGPGADALTIDGNGSDRVFLHGGKGTLTLTDLTIAGGTLHADTAAGGCIYSKGSLALTRSTLTACKAIGQTTAIGGGAFAFEDMTLESSTVSGNLADATVGQAKNAALGGGVVALGQGEGLTVLHSVVSGNTVHAASGSALGGGVSGFAVTAKYSTFTGNMAKAIGDATNYGAAGGIVSLYSLSMTNSTVDHNVADLAGGIFVGANHHPEHDLDEQGQPCRRRHRIGRAAVDDQQHGRVQYRRPIRRWWCVRDRHGHDAEFDHRGQCSDRRRRRVDGQWRKQFDQDCGRQHDTADGYAYG